MTSVHLPKIVYGTAWKKDQTAALVVTAVLQGFRAIDTAGQPKHYREDLVGAGLQDLYHNHGFKREDLFLQTKFTPEGGQETSKPMPYDPSAPLRVQLASSLQVSLTNLQTTYLDSYLLHSPLATFPATLEAWRTLAQFQDDGKARMIGVSNTYDVRVLELLSKVRKVQVVQNRWHQGNGWDKDVVDYCRRNGIMYQSFWTLGGSPDLLSNPAVVSISESHGITPAQILFKLAQLEGITPLSGTTSKVHMKQDVEIESIDLQEENLETELKAVRNLISK